MNERIRELKLQMLAVQSGKPWIGSNFKSKIKQVPEEDFFRRPIESMHSLAEIISHLTTWRKETLLKIETGQGSITDAHPSNWKKNADLIRIGRSRILSDYDQSLSAILEQLEEKTDEFLDQTYYDTDFKGEYTYDWLLHGMLQHDLYHLGQIGYIAKFLKIGGKNK